MKGKLEKFIRKSVQEMYEQKKMTQLNFMEQWKKEMKKSREITGLS